MRFAPLPALLGVALLAAGCGGGGVTSGNPAGGKELFASKCGSCHVLADAGTPGTVGPNLDDAFRAAREDRFEQTTFEQVVREQMELPAAPMPSREELGLTGSQADDIAAYVASVAGLGGAPPPATGGGETP